MSDTRWKRLEREVAKRVGGTRIPVTGERDGADVSHPLFAFQVKSRKTIPSWLATWLAGITGTARAQGKIGVLVLHQPGTEVDDALVVLRMRDWVDLHGSQRTCPIQWVPTGVMQRVSCIKPEGHEGLHESAEGYGAQTKTGW